MYRLKEFINKSGNPAYQVQKKIFGIWLTLFFIHRVNEVTVSIFADFPGIANYKNKENLTDSFNDAVWSKAKRIVKARKIKKARKEGKVTYHKFP